MKTVIFYLIVSANKIIIMYFMETKTSTFLDHKKKIGLFISDVCSYLIEVLISTQHIFSL